MAKYYILPKVGAVKDSEAGVKTVFPKVGAVSQFPVVSGGPSARPQNPMGHPIKGVFGGPIG